MKKKLLVISSYPPKGSTHNGKVVGVATYAKNTLLGMTGQNKDLEVTVLAEKLEGEKSYKEGPVNVERIWRRNSIFSYFSLFKQILGHKETKSVLIEFELAMFGGMVSLLPFPIFLLLLKLMGKKVSVVFHQVITDLKEVHGQMGIEKEGSKTQIYGFLIRLFYISILKTVSKVVVFEKVLKQRLIDLSKSSEKKIFVIPHGVERFDSEISKKEARKILKLNENDLVILNFGFIAWYKGTDKLLDDYKARKGRKLIIAGGPNPNHLDKKYYIKYLKKIKDKAKKKNVLVTGFVPEDKIELYFASCDAVVFPYRALISASGPLSMAFSFGKPVLLSDKLKDLLQTKDFKSALKGTGLEQKDLIFSNPDELELRFKNVQNLGNLGEFSKRMASERSWEKIGKTYNQIL